MALLEVKSLGISFGGLRAVDDFNLKIEKGQLYGLIGPNGAGKTTVFNMLTGVYKPTDGSIFLDGENITGKKTIDINKHGIARTFQNIRLFHQQSVKGRFFGQNFRGGRHAGGKRLCGYFPLGVEEGDRRAEEGRQGARPGVPAAERRGKRPAD